MILKIAFGRLDGQSRPVNTESAMTAPGKQNPGAVFCRVCHPAGFAMGYTQVF